MPRCALPTRPIAWLMAAALSAPLVGCDRPPPARSRADVTLRADGRCDALGEPRDCAAVGALLAQHFGPDRVSVVIRVAPQAPTAGLQALRTSLNEAQVRHVQQGDGQGQVLDPDEKGFKL